MHFRLIAILGILFLSAVSSPSVFGSDAREAELDAILRGLASAKTVQGRFIQTRSTKALRAPLRMRGEFCMEQGAFAWHIQSPTAFSVVARDGVLRQWDALSDRVTTIDMKRKPSLSALADAMRSFASGDVASLRPNFHVELLDSKTVSLTPKPFHHSARFLKRILFELDESRRGIRRILIEETNGDTTDIVYVTQRLNEPIPPSQWNVRRK